MKIKEVIVNVWRRKMSDGHVELYFDYMHHGKRVRRSSKIRLTCGRSRMDKRRDEEALMLFEDKRRELQRVLNGHAVDYAEGGDVLLYDYYEELMDRKKPSTRLTWQKALVHIKAYEPDGMMTLGEVTKEWLMGLRDHLLGSGLAVNTASMYWDKICATLNAAVADELLERNPAMGVKGIAKSPSTKCFLTMEELKMIDRTVSRFDVTKRAFLFSCMTGLRYSDVRALTWSCIKANNDGRLYVDVKQIKTGEAASIILNEFAVRQMGARVADGVPVFELMENRAEGYRLECVMKEAGVKKHVTFHVGRHTAATLLLEADADIYTVSKILGHRSIAATQVYAKVVDKKKQQALDRLGELMK